LFARGVRRRALPDLAKQPERWRAALLELAARLEPRPIVLPCSRRAATFLAQSCHTIGPHFEVGAREESGPVPDVAWRRALARGEAVLEVQLVRDSGGTTTGACVLAWAPAATPDVVVSSVEGSDIVRRSQTWAASHGIVGYLRLLWAPDRFGRLSLH